MYKCRVFLGLTEVPNQVLEDQTACNSTAKSYIPRPARHAHTWCSIHENMVINHDCGSLDRLRSKVSKGQRSRTMMAIFRPICLLSMPPLRLKNTCWYRHTKPRLRWCIKAVSILLGAPPLWEAVRWHSRKDFADHTGKRNTEVCQRLPCLAAGASESGQYRGFNH